MLILQHDVLTALGLTLLAGLATGIGALIAMLNGKGSPRTLSWAMGFAAGVMIYLTLMDILPESAEALGDDTAAWTKALLAFFGGMALMVLIDVVVPEDENTHAMHHALDKSKARHICHPTNNHKCDRMYRTGLMLCATIAIHNFPEGVATFISALDGLEVALPLVLAISIHNIPMGIAMATPLYHSTGSRRAAMGYTMAAGMTGVIGALFALLFLLPFWNETVAALCMAAVGGVMVFIAFDELLPGAEAHGKHHFAIFGVIIGFAVMAFSLLLL